MIGVKTHVRRLSVICVIIDFMCKVTRYSQNSSHNGYHNFSEMISERAKLFKGVRYKSSFIPLTFF